MGSYELTACVGLGAFGAVYEAIQRESETRRVAIKVLHGVMAAQGEVVSRFARESRVLAGLAHPHIVRVLEVGNHLGMPYLVMEFLDGETLGERLRREGPMTVQAVVDLLLPVMSAVSAVHAAGVVHRDIKPSNIMLVRGADGAVEPKLLDFGIAKALASETTATRSAVFLGTPHYASPEQVAESRAVDPRSDQYSLGAILYEAVAGRTPHAPGATMEVLLNALHAPIPPLVIARGALPAGFEPVVRTMLARNPSDRFADVRAAARALLPFASGAAQARWAGSF